MIRQIWSFLRMPLYSGLFVFGIASLLKLAFEGLTSVGTADALTTASAVGISLAGRFWLHKIGIWKLGGKP